MLLLAVPVTLALAQDDYIGAPRVSFETPFNRYVTFNISAHYGVAIPMGTQTDYINRISPTNAVMQLEWMFPQRFSLGLKSGYQYTQQRLGRQVYQFDTETVSAVQTRTLTMIPALATAAFYFTDNAAAFRPYVQIGGGVARVNYTTFWGTLADQQANFRGAIAPAVGFKLFGRREGGLGLDVQAQYQQVFFKYNEINNSQNLLLSAGLTYRWY
ncbi:hypothetical protein GCM10023189_19730 [Nibrella saemangeumensis]|uniref:Outer membrane protein beta-barrel domain-containing protein n=2 Tax=Nibrella saemangeumensis TaxID=1084526 RepID=A0ABP8MT14_9BACT